MRSEKQIRQAMYNHRHYSAIGNTVHSQRCIEMVTKLESSSPHAIELAQLILLKLEELEQELRENKIPMPKASVA